MIGDNYYTESEYAYKVRATLHKEKDNGIDSLTYLPMKLREFCDRTGCNPKDVFKRSRKTKYVMLRVAFFSTLPNDIQVVRIARFLNYNHATVIHWRDKLHPEFLEYPSYRKLLTKL